MHRILELSLAVGGGLSPVQARDAVELVDATGARRFGYGELFVRDHAGRELPSKLEVRDGHIVIALDATNAAYPVEIDPVLVTFVQRITKASVSFGGDVALAGTTMVVGAINSTTTGQAFVYTEASNTWTEKATLSGTGAIASAFFGYAVDVDAGTIAVGAALDGKTAGSTTTKSGAVYVFTGSGASWTQQQRLAGSDTVANARFGTDVSVEGDTLVVGAPSIATTGAVYVFTRTGTTWTERTKIVPAGSALAGAAVALSAGRLFIGDPATRQVYVWSGSGASWSQQQVINNPGTNNSNKFGGSLAVDGDTLVVGAHASSGLSGGYAYRYGTSWTLEMTLEELTSASDFGVSVALSGDDAFVGESTYSGDGRVHWYQRSGTAWSAKTPIAPSVSGTPIRFGESLAAGNGWLAAGDGGSGAVEMFALKSANGDPCGGPAECGSGYCVDGVCCNTACAGTCQGCSAATKGSGSDGTCGSAASGSDPHDNCATQAQSTCGTTGVCNGAGACEKYANGTSCAGTSCASATSQNNARSCDGSGACKAATVTNCQTGYRCTGNACLTTCANDGECAGGYYCDAGACKAAKAIGGGCSKTSMCSSGHCIDGVCCNTACGGKCQACSAARKGQGADGTCGNIQNGLDPDDECAVSGGTCGFTGACDGSGACAYSPAGKACGATTCVGNNTTGQICDGAGTCKNDTTGTNCAPYVCSTTTNACATPCTADTDCVSGNYCNASGACVALKPAGGGCGAANECTTGYCVDGVCCGTACTGTCQACKDTLKASGTDNGTCGDAASGTDPHDNCADDTSTTCQKNGFCDGAGQCSVYAAGTQCGAPACSSDIPTTAECDGAGQCKIKNGTSCFPAACSAGACVGGDGGAGCTTDPDCSGSAYCDAGSCVQKHPDGDACTAARECANAHCVDGYCCNTACDGQCEACDVGGSVGTCSGVTGAPHGSRAACPAATGSDPCTARACDPNKSLSDCAGYAGTAVSCRAQSCSGGIETFGASCDGSGQCPAVKTKECTPYVCGADACLDSCAKAGDCADGTVCDTTAGLCKPGSSCIDDYTVQEAGKDPVSCLPYRCVAGGCQKNCASSDDCAPGSICDDAAKTCVGGADGGINGAGADDSGGCGCAVPGKQPARAPREVLWLALGAAVMLRRRRRAG